MLGRLACCVSYLGQLFQAQHLMGSPRTARLSAWLGGRRVLTSWSAPVCSAGWSRESEL